jgi:hypothetical protein
VRRQLRRLRRRDGQRRLKKHPPARLCGLGEAEVQHFACGEPARVVADFVSMTLAGFKSR